MPLQNTSIFLKTMKMLAVAFTATNLKTLRQTLKKYRVTKSHRNQWNRQFLRCLYLHFSFCSPTTIPDRNSNFILGTPCQITNKSWIFISIPNSRVSADVAIERAINAHIDHASYTNQASLAGGLGPKENSLREGRCR